MLILAILVLGLAAGWVAHLLVDRGGEANWLQLFGVGIAGSFVACALGRDLRAGTIQRTHHRKALPRPSVDQRGVAVRGLGRTRPVERWVTPAQNGSPARPRPSVNTGDSRDALARSDRIRLADG